MDWSVKLTIALVASWYRAAIIMWAWAWFVTPLDAPGISWVHAWGLTILVAMFGGERTVDVDAAHDAAMKSFTKSTVFLAFAWIAHGLMGVFDGV